MFRCADCDLTFLADREWKILEPSGYYRFVTVLQYGFNHWTFTDADGPDGGTEEIYSGPDKPPWDSSGKMQKNGARPLSVSRLRKLAIGIEPGDRISIR